MAFFFRRHDTRRAVTLRHGDAAMMPPMAADEAPMMAAVASHCRYATVVTPQPPLIDEAESAEFTPQHAVAATPFV